MPPPWPTGSRRHPRAGPTGERLHRRRASASGDAGGKGDGPRPQQGEGRFGYRARVATHGVVRPWVDGMISPGSGLGPRERAQIDAVVALIRGVLGPDVVGVYLYGSAVADGLRGASDLDLFVVSARPSTSAEKRTLIDRLLPISGSRAVAGPARSIELTIVVQADVRPWRYPPLLDFQYGDWMRADFERGDWPPWPIASPDLAVLLTTVLLEGVPLVGPPPAEVIDPGPRADLDQSMLDGTPDLLADLESDTGNVILTLARIWTTLASGEIWSKDAAASWVLERLPAEHRPAVARARAIYVGDELESWADLMPRARRTAEYLETGIRAQQGSDPTPRGGR